MKSSKQRRTEILAHRRGERFGQLADAAGEIGEGELLAGAVLAAEDRGDGSRRALGPHVHACLGEVQAAPLEPRRPLDPARVVEHGVPRPRPVELEVGGNGAPEAVGVVDRDPVQCRVVLAAESARQPRQVCRLQLPRGRSPGIVDASVRDHEPST